MAKLINDSYTLSGKMPGRGCLFDEVLFSYRPALPEKVYTYLRAQAGATGKEVHKIVTDILKEHLVSWNFEDANGAAKITSENLSRVPQPVLDYMLDHVTGYRAEERKADEGN